MRWGKDSLTAAARDYVANLDVLGRSLAEITATVCRIEALSLPEAERDLVTRTFRKLADSLKGGDQARTFDAALTALKQFESQMRAAAVA